MNELASLLEEVPHVVTEISPDDDMYQHDPHPEHYFRAGRMAIRDIRVALLSIGKTEVPKILDMGCAYGRILRALKAAFPDSSITACDINSEGVDFCANVLGATPVYSAVHPSDIPLSGPFDLVWCSSLITDLDREGIKAFFDFFESVLDPEAGLLVFTTHGRKVAERLRRGIEPFGLNEAQIEALLRDFDRDGFGYTDWHTDQRRAELALPVNFGVSLASPAWMCNELQTRKGLQLVTYREGPDWWNPDTIACVKSRE